MEFTSQTLLLYLVMGIFLFCYFLITWVWIKADKIKRDTITKND